MNRTVKLAGYATAATLFLAATSRADVTWKMKYEGNVEPTTGDCVTFSDSYTTSFYTAYNAASSSNGSVLNIPPTFGAAGIYRIDPNQPYPAKTTMSLDSVLGYTAEWRAKLNSSTTAGEYASAGMYIAEAGATKTAFFVGMNDINGGTPGYAVRLSGNGSAAPAAVADGFHTFRLTVQGATPATATANLYIDGTLASTLVGSTSSAQEIRFGDFNGASNSDWDLDYLYVYDGGAVAPIVGVNQWQVDASSSWTTLGNWTSSVPNGVDAAANFLGAISAPRTVIADTGVVVGSLKFDNANSYQIAGQGSLTIDVSTGAGSISVVQGSHKINLPLLINDNTTADVAAGATLKISDPMTLAAGATLTKTGTGTLSIEAPVLNASPATIALASGVTSALMDLGTNTTVSVSGGTTNLSAAQHLAALNVAGGTANVGPGKTVVVSTKSLAITGTGKVDLQNSKMVVDYTGTSALNAVKIAINSGSLTSSQLAAGRAIGYGEASDLFAGPSGSFAGETVDSTSIVMAFTVTADASLDGTVNSTDFNLLAGHYGQLSNSRWTQGDFNGDGKVTTLDFNLLAGNFGASLPAGASLGAVVPEPVSVVGVCSMSLLMFSRRRNGLRHH